ncbi:MAG TPA: hypothetical protein VKZ84_04075 [Bacteriovoracaceae bacterium]|nr:hypothetical protein [Bacteriovoracaceae bacterium]
MRKKISVTNFIKPLVVASLVLVGACGSDDDDSTNVIVNPDGPQREEEGPISTRPTIIINNKIVNNVRMSVRRTTRIEENNFYMDWQCGNIDPVEHKQYIHAGSRCPTLENDLNGDGYLDAVELEQAVGPGLLALDSNPSSEEVDSFPAGASFEYSTSIPLPLLRRIIPATEDFIVVLYGVDPATPLPDTVASNSDNEIHSTIPIACKVFEAPEAPEAPEVEDSTTGGTTTGGTTNGGTTNGDTTNGGTTNGETTNGDQ